MHRSPMSRPPGRGTTPLTVVLLLTISLSLWLGYEAFAAARGHRAAVEATLRDYTAMAAWELSRQTRVSLRWFVEEVFDDLRDRRGALRPPGSLKAGMADASDRHHCACPSLRVPLMELRLDYPERRPILVPDTLNAEVVDRLVAVLDARVAQPESPRRGVIIAGPGEVFDDAARIGYTTDERPGVPAAERRRIWHPYRRLDRDVRSRHPGSGVGLAVVAALSRQHGGDAWVEDAPGVGARFVVELPEAAAPEREPSASVEVA